MKNVLQVESLTAEQFANVVGNIVESKLEAFLSKQNPEPEQEELMTRKEVLELLKINPSTLWNWQNSNRIRVYKIHNKNYYKRAEVMGSLTEIKKG